MKNNIAMTILVILGIMCVIYGIIVLGLNTGTMTCVIWFGLGGIFFLAAAAVRLHLWSKFPLGIKIPAAILIGCVLASFLFIEGCILSGCFMRGEKNLNYIIVLGAQVTDHGPSRVLRYRLDEAYDYLMEHEDTICIVSGGQGSNEPFSEAEGMKDYLEKRGIDSERIYMEAQSLTTTENLENSKEIIDQIQKEEKRESYSVGIITNNFHTFRGTRLAKHAGLENVSGISAGTSPFFFLNNVVREYFGVLKDFRNLW